MARPFLTIREAADHACVSRSYMWKLVDRGVIVAYRVGPEGGRRTPIRIDTQSFLAWLYGSSSEEGAPPMSQADLAPWVEAEL